MDVLTRVNELDSAIRHIAIQGFQELYTDSAPTNINWKEIDQFIAVYLESLERAEYSFRLFERLDDGCYDSRSFLSPSYDGGPCQCVYEHTETEGKTISLNIYEGSWYQEFMEVITED